MTRDLEALRDEELLLLRSIEDLDREHASGDIEDDDYAALRSRYSARAAEVARSIDEASATPGAAVPATAAVGDSGSEQGNVPSPPVVPSGRRVGRWLAGHRRLVVSAAVGCFALAALFLSLALAGVAPFTSAPATLSVAARIRIELAEAGVLAQNHDIAQAVATYDDVLALDAHQPEALADGGWLTRLAGVSAHDPTLVRSGDLEIALAVKIAPGYALARAYDGVVLLADDHDPRGAVAEFKAMLGDEPGSTLLGSVRPYAASAYGAEHLPLPGSIAKA